MIHLLIGGILLTVIYFIAQGAAPHGFASDAVDVSFPLSTDSSWNGLLNLSHNAYLSWRLDPLWSVFGSLTLHQVLILSLGIFAFGTLALLLRASSSKNIWWAISVSIILPCALLFLFSWDRVVLLSLSWIPISAFALLLATMSRANILPFTVVFLFLGIRIAKSANHLSTASVLSASALCLVLVLQECESRSRSKSDHLPLWVFYSLILLIPSMILLWYIPNIPLPSYPYTATLVPDDGIPGHITPLFTQYLSPPVIDRPFVKSVFSRGSILLFLLSVVLWLLSGKSKTARFSVLFCVSLSLMLLFDTLLPEEFSQIAPLASIARNVSWLNYFPLVSFAFGFAFFSLLVQCAIQFSPSLFYLSTCLLLFAPLSQGLGSYELARQWGALQKTDRTSTRDSLTSLVTTHRLNKLSQSRLEKILYSPSYQVIGRVGLTPMTPNDGDSIRLWPIDGAERVSHMKFLPLARFEVELSASHQGDFESLSKLSDRSRKTRWTAGRAMQDGSEWLHLRFASPVNLDGIYLNTGEFGSDFPRAFEVRAKSECNTLPSSGSPSFESYQLLVSANPWLGPLKYTEDGYPYFGNQAEVRIPFKQSSRLRCLFVRQLGKAPYDWSIAEVRLAVKED